MKEKVSPGIFIGIIAAVVAVAAFIGYKVLVPQKSSTSSAQEMAKIMASHPGNRTAGDAVPTTGGANCPGGMGGPNGAHRAGAVPTEAGSYPSSGGGTPSSMGH